jgi:hypothetical protein
VPGSGRNLLALVLTVAPGTVLLNGQVPRQAGLVRGVVVSNEPGDLVVQASTSLSYHYRTDNKTWIEREQERIRVSDLHQGEILEVVSDREPQLIRYARLVHVIEKAVPPRVNWSAGGVYRLPRGKSAEAPPLTYSGIISSLDGRKMILRTRFDGEIPIFLRDDTRVSADGAEANLSDLKINQRIFIRAARNREDFIEAFEIIWSRLLAPADRRE